MSSERRDIGKRKARMRTIAEFYGCDVQAEGLVRQLSILRSCGHRDRTLCGVRVSSSELLEVCLPCIHLGRAAFDAGRKAYLKAYWHSQASIQDSALKDCHLAIGMRVQRFCPSMLGFGGMTLTGKLVRNRNGIAVVRMDATLNGKRFTGWDYGWRPVKDGAL
jgi:hypothetical protein